MGVRKKGKKSADSEDYGKQAKTNNVGARQCPGQVEREANTAVPYFTGTISPNFQAPIYEPLDKTRTQKFSSSNTMKNTEQIWATSKDGSIQYQSINQALLRGTMQVLRNSFFLYENVCVALGLPEEPLAISELNELVLKAIRDGVSIAAVDTTTGKVAGVAVNKILVRNEQTKDMEYYDNYASSCRFFSSKGIVQYMKLAPQDIDIFKICNVDCVVELNYVAVLPEYRGKGIAKKLMEVSIDLFQKLRNGENIKVPLNGEKLSLEPVPKVVTGIFTSLITQKLGKQLDFQMAKRVSYEDYFYEGKSLASISGDYDSDYTIEYKWLYSD